MNIGRIQLFKYSLPFLTPLKIKDKIMNVREGYLINISDKNGNKGWGEIAPLDGFSSETKESVLSEINDIKDTLENNQIPQDILKILNPYSPSVRFGFESALLTLMASEKKLTLAGFLNPMANLKININALLGGNYDDVIKRTKYLYSKGYKTFKLKIGRKNLEDEIRLIENIIEIIKQDGKIRLDANRMLSPETTEDFFNKLSALPIDYLEEPYASKDDIKELLDSLKIPIAFDESLTEIQPTDLKDYKSLKAVVLKPTILGYTNSMAFATNAISLGIIPVISSSFESPLGIYILASMSAIIDNQAYVGLETIDRFENKLFPYLDISNGILDLNNYQNFFDKIETNNFEEIKID